MFIHGVHIHLQNLANNKMKMGENDFGNLRKEYLINFNDSHEEFNLFCKDNDKI